MSKIYLILGGARSGKSSYGEEMASSIYGKVAYIATARITDIEMEKRVRAHRQRRPPRSGSLMRLGEMKQVKRK